MHFLVFLWIPTYYNQNYGIDVRESALLSIFPWACAIVATLTAGAVVDTLTSREVLPLTQVRKLMQGIGSFGPAGCLFYLAWLDKVRSGTMLVAHFTACVAHFTGCVHIRCSYAPVPPQLMNKQPRVCFLLRCTLQCAPMRCTLLSCTALLAKTDETSRCRLQWLMVVSKR